MYAKSINLLVVEDDEIDRIAYKRASKNFHFPVNSTVVSSLEEFRNAVALNDFDIIFTDYYLEDGTAEDVIKLSNTTPVLVATGANDIQVAVDVLKMGAFDFLVKDFDRNYLNLLPFTIQKALVKKSALENEKLLSSVVRNIKDSVLIINKNNNIQFVNPSFCEIYGYSESEITGKPVEIIIPDKDSSEGVFFNVDNRQAEQVHVRKNGTPFTVSVTVTASYDNSGEIASKIVICTDVSERQQMLNEIKKKQQQLSIIFDNSVVGIGMFETDGKLVQYNSRLKDITGYSDIELQNSSMQTLFHPDDTDINKNSYLNLISNLIESYTSEKRLVRKSGDIVWVKLTLSMVKEENDGQAYVIIIFENITERKRIEEELKVAEVRVDGIMSSLKDVVYSVNPETMEVYYVNKAVEDVLELTADEIKNDYNQWVKMVHGGDLMKLKVGQKQLVQDGKSELEYRVILPTGVLRWIRDRSWLVYDDQGKVVRIDGIITDISERKTAELAHRDSEERYHAAVQS